MFRMGSNFGEKRAIKVTQKGKPPVFARSSPKATTNKKDLLTKESHNRTARVD
jgi:hypothetical protein